MRTRLLENEIRVLRDESNRLALDLQGEKEKVKENMEKIKLNKQLPYLVGNVVEILDLKPEVRGTRKSEATRGGMGRDAWVVVCFAGSVGALAEGVVPPTPPRRPAVVRCLLKPTDARRSAPSAPSSQIRRPSHSAHKRTLCLQDDRETGFSDWWTVDGTIPTAL